jgi:hypothetical protein
MAALQHVLERPAQIGAVAGDPAELGAALRVQAPELGVENLDFEAKPGPCPFEDLRKRRRQHHL